MLSVAGNTTHDEVMRLAEEHFGGVPAGESPPRAAGERGVRRRARGRREARDRAVPPGHRAVRAAARSTRTAIALTVLNTILGRGMSSRLFKEVRERRGLAYSVGSGTSRYNDIGTMSISAGVTLEHLEEATQVIRDELFKLAETAPADDETTRARDFSIGNFRLGLESTMALAQRAGESLLMTGEIDAIEDVVAATAGGDACGRAAGGAGHLPPGCVLGGDGGPGWRRGRAAGDPGRGVAAGSTR